MTISTFYEVTRKNLPHLMTRILGTSRLDETVSSEATHNQSSRAIAQCSEKRHGMAVLIGMAALLIGLGPWS